MNSAVTFIVLLGCCSVWTSARRPSVSYSMVFSGGTVLLVHAGDEDNGLHHRLQTKGSASSVHPSIRILMSVPDTVNPGSPHLLVCLVSGLTSPLQDVLWWVNDTVVTSAFGDISLMRSEEGGVYSAISVWEVSAAEWRSRSTYWCGMIQDRQVFRKKLCSQD